MRLFQSDPKKNLAVTWVAILLSPLALWNLDPYWILGSVIAFQIYWILGLTVGLHRYFTHRSFQTTPKWREAFIWAAATSLSGHPGLYAIVHLEHHRLSDTPEDPHKFFIRGWFITSKNVHIPLTPTMKRAFVSDPVMMRSYRYYLAYPFLTSIALFCISPWALIYLWAIPVVAMQVFRKYVTLQWVHQFGYQSYQTGDSSRNSRILGLLFGGEGFHNTHHRFPQDWNFSRHWSELDPGAWVIRAIKCSPPSSNLHT